MHQWEHFAILSHFIKLPIVIKIFVLSGRLRQVLLYAQKPPLNAHADILLQGNGGWKFVLSLPLLLIFVYARSKGSKETANMGRLVSIKWSQAQLVPKSCVKNSEYDQEIPHSQTADKPMALRGRATQTSQFNRKTN